MAVREDLCCIAVMLAGASVVRHLEHPRILPSGSSDRLVGVFIVRNPFDARLELVHCVAQLVRAHDVIQKILSSDANWHEP